MAVFPYVLLTLCSVNWLFWPRNTEQVESFQQFQVPEELLDDLWVHERLDGLPVRFLPGLLLQKTKMLVESRGEDPVFT